MFLGEYGYRIDEKGRAPLPPRFRPEFRDGVVLTAGADKCVLVYTPAQWRKVADTLTSGPLPTSKMRKLGRAIFASAFQLNVDGQGRIAIPSPLRQYAGIAEDVVIVGNNAWLEIWEKQTWDQEKTDSLAQAWQTIESLEKR